jgi:hypothetical protein
MGVIVTYSDFTSGPLKLALGTFQQTDFAAYVTPIEREYLRKLLTDKIQAEIYAASTYSPKYAALINGNSYVDSGGTTRTNVGIKEVLKRFVYYHYAADNFQSTTVGKTQNQNENSRLLNNAENRQIIFKKYNEGVDYWNNDMILFLNEFASQQKTIDSFVDLGGSCRINSADTGYLLDGDTVKIGGVSYTVSGLIVNTSFIIQGTGLTPSGTYTFEPFPDVNTCNYLPCEWL